MVYTKEKISVSVNRETVKQMESLVDDGRFRNKSHVVEYSLNELFREFIAKSKTEEKK
ncbi:MAG: hypothetical protein WC475_01265 [Candidatus Paceibacterota bacterium]